MDDEHNLALDWIDGLWCLAVLFGSVAIVYALDINALYVTPLCGGLVGATCLALPRLREKWFNKPRRDVAEGSTALGFATAFVVVLGFLTAIATVALWHSTRARHWPWLAVGIATSIALIALAGILDRARD